MSRTKNSAASQRRAYFGEDRASALIRWLNEEGSSSEEIRRIAALIEDLNNLNSIQKPAPHPTALRRKRHPPSREQGKRRKPLSEEWAEAGKLVKLGSRVAERLDCYRLRPSISLSGEDEYTVTWSSEPEDRHDGIWVFGEADAVVAVIQLAQLRHPHSPSPLIRRIRTCKNCGEWFFARLRHKEFCGEDCQQAFNRSKPEFKKHRANYMYKWRREEGLVGARKDKKTPGA